MNPYEAAWMRLEPVLGELKALAECDPEGMGVVAKAEAVLAFLEGARLTAPKDPWFEGLSYLRGQVLDALGHMGGSSQRDRLSSALQTTDVLVETLGGSVSWLDDDGGDQ